jgi:hypothetical protein
METGERSMSEEKGFFKTLPTQVVKITDPPFSVSYHGKYDVGETYYEIDYEKKVFTSTYDNLHIDFHGNGWEFNLEDWCHISAGEHCTFNAGSFCVFSTLSDCVFNTNNSCVFAVGDDCVFDVGVLCTISLHNAYTTTFKNFDVKTVVNDLQYDKAYIIDEAFRLQQKLERNT